MLIFFDNLRSKCSEFHDFFFFLISESLTTVRPTTDETEPSTGRPTAGPSTMGRPTYASTKTTGQPDDEESTVDNEIVPPTASFERPEEMFQVNQ